MHAASSTRMVAMVHKRCPFVWSMLALRPFADLEGRQGSHALTSLLSDLVAVRFHSHSVVVHIGRMGIFTSPVEAVGWR